MLDIDTMQNYYRNFMKSQN